MANMGDSFKKLELVHTFGDFTGNCIVHKKKNEVFDHKSILFNHSFCNPCPTSLPGTWIQRVYNTMLVMNFLTDSHIGHLGLDAN
jgi:hypothetical protein